MKIKVSRGETVYCKMMQSYVFFLVWRQVSNKIMLISIPAVVIIMQSLDLKQAWGLFYQEYSLPLHKE